MNVLLKTDALTLARGGRCLIDGLELTIRTGERWAVIGPNGCGKSTLLKSLAGLLPPAGGHIHLPPGTPLHGLPPRERARRIGLVFQHGNPGLHNSTLELVMSGHHPHRQHWWDTPEELAAARHALGQVGLAEQAAQNAQTLSGGELRRAEIARLLVQNPALAMLDEPFNHLDIAQQVAMTRLLGAHFTRDGRALLMVVHDINMASGIASHCLLLHGDGRWRAGRAREILNRETLSELFDHPLQACLGRNGTVWMPSWE